jgi:hypothetical protein
VRRGAYARLTIYEVEENELELLAQGSPDSLYLNFAIFLLSIAVSFLIALLTLPANQATGVSGTGSSNRFIVLVVITTIGFIVGLLLLLIWLKKRRSISDIVQRIKDRLPPEGIQKIGTSTDEVK